MFWILFSELDYQQKDVPLEQLTSGSLSDLTQTDEEGRSDQYSVIHVYAVSITFAIGITVALILNIHLGLSFVRVVQYNCGWLLHCLSSRRFTFLRCLRKVWWLLTTSSALLSARRSFATAGPVWMRPSLPPCVWVLCILTGQALVGMWVQDLLLLCVRRPCGPHVHVSGRTFIRGSHSSCRGGVMLVHDIQRNKTTVINFQGTSPKALTEEMLKNVSQLKVV